MTDIEKKAHEENPSSQAGKPTNAPTAEELAAQKKLDDLVANPSTLDIYDNYLVWDLSPLLDLDGQLTVNRLRDNALAALAYDEKVDPKTLKKEFVDKVVELARANRKWK